MGFADSLFRAGARTEAAALAKGAAKAEGAAAARGASGFAGKALKLGMGYGIVKGIGNALAGTGSGDSNKSSMTGRFGIVGSAGRRSGSAGGGVMPNFAQSSSVAVQRNASQLIMLETAVKLLASIDSSLKVQNKQQEFIARQQILQQREMQQEETQGNTTLAERISNIRNSKAGSVLGSILKTSLLGAAAYLAFKLGDAETTVTDILKQANDILIKVGLGTIATGALIKGGKGAYGAFKTTRAAEKAAKLAAEQAAATAAAERAIGKGGMTAAQYSAYQLYRKMGMGSVAAKRQAIRTHQPSPAGSFTQMEQNAGLRGAEGASKTSLLKTLLKGGGKGLLKGALKGMKLPAVFEAFLYATGIQELTGRNIAGSIGSLIGGSLGLLGGGGILSAATGVAGAYAGNELFTRAYDWFTGKPSTAGKDQSSYVPSGDKKVDFAMQYLMKELGLTNAQASGIVGNLMGESQLDTNATNNAGGGRGAYGIAQWRGARQDALDAFAASRGKRRDDYETQLAFLVKELKENPSNGLAELKNAKTADEATKIFLDKFERPSELDKARSIRKRIAFSMAAASGSSMSTAQSDYSDQAAAAAGFEGSEGLVGLLETQEKFKNVMKRLAPTNVMTKVAPEQMNSSQAASAIQSQAAAMEAALRGKARAAAQNATPTLVGVSGPQNISNPSGGAFTCPNPGYEDNGMIDYLVYFGLAA